MCSSSSAFSSSLVLSMPNISKDAPYPIYAAAPRWFPASDSSQEEKLLIATAGGGANVQFIGSPVHIINVTESLHVKL